MIYDLRRIIYFAGHEWWLKFLAAVIFGVVSLVAEIYIVIGGSSFFSELISSNLEHVQKSGPWLILVVALYVLTKLIFYYLSAVFSFGLAQRLAVLVYAAMCGRDFLDIRSRHSSEYVALAQKSNMIAGGFVTQLLNLVISIIGIIALMILLIIQVPFFGTIGFIGLGCCYGLLLLLLDKKVKTWSKQISEKTDAVFKLVEDTFQGFRELKLEGLFQKSTNIYSNVEAGLKSHQSRIMILASVPKTLLEGVGIIFLIAFVLLGLRQGDIAPQVLESVLILALGAQRMLPHIQQAYSSFVNANGANANAKSLLAELNAAERSIQSHSEVPYVSNILSKDGNYIQLSGVEVNFTPNKPQETILKLPDLKIHRGEVALFSGTSGSGKSTALDVLAGLIPAHSGQIHLLTGGPPSNNESRFRVSYCGQTSFLYDGTLKENIFMGGVEVNENFEKNALREALDIVNLGSLFERFGNTTSIGQMGSKLSGGQRQRLTVARAVMKPADLYIFDESFNAVDPDTLSEIVPKILNRLKGKTVIVVSHQTGFHKDTFDQVVEFKS